MSAAPILSFSKDLEELTEEKVEEFRRRGTTLARRAGISSFDAEDISQNAIIKCYKNYSCYEGRSSLTNWFYSILKNEIRDYIRTNKRRPDNSDLAFEDQEEPAALSTPEEEYILNEKKTLIEWLLPTYPLFTQLIYHLYTHDGLTFEEIGDHFCLNKNNVRLRYHRLRVSLKKTIAQRKAA